MSNLLAANSSLLCALKKREIGLKTSPCSTRVIQKIVESSGARSCNRKKSISFNPFSFSPTLTSAINLEYGIVASGHVDSKIRLSDPRVNKHESSNSCETAYVTCVVFHPALEYIMASGTRLGEVKTVRLSQSNILKAFPISLGSSLEANVRD